MFFFVKEVQQIVWISGRTITMSSSSQGQGRGYQGHGQGQGRGGYSRGGGGGGSLRGGRGTGTGAPASKSQITFNPNQPASFPEKEWKNEEKRQRKVIQGQGPGQGVRGKEGAGARATSGREEGSSCIVCYKDVKYYSVGTCDHGVCFECSARMKVLLEQNECPICRTPVEQVSYLGLLFFGQFNGINNYIRFSFRLFSLAAFASIANSRISSGCSFTCQSGESTWRMRE